MARHARRATPAHDDDRTDRPPGPRPTGHADHRQARTACLVRTPVDGCPPARGPLSPLSYLLDPHGIRYDQSAPRPRLASTPRSGRRLTRAQRIPNIPNFTTLTFI